MTDPSSTPRTPCVAFLIDRWDPQRGGAERAMAQLAEHLLARGWRVLAVAAEHAADAPGEHVRAAAKGVTRAQRERRLARALVATAREHGAEVTIGCRHLYECDLYWPHGGAHRPAMLAARESRPARPSWWPEHPRHRAFLELERELLDRGGARVVACVSRMVLDELAREWPACRERLVLVENGVDLTRFHAGARAILGQRTREELGVRPSAVMLVLAARNPWLKGLETLLAALTLVLRDRWLDWQLVVAGSARPPGWSAKARGRENDAHELCAPGRVIWREHVDAPALFAAADLCVLPSWRDASPLVLLEALACGVPVITTRRAGGCELVDEHSGAVVPEPGDPDALAQALRRWIERVRAGQIDREHVRSRVAHRDVAPWLARLETLALELARPREHPQTGERP